MKIKTILNTFILIIFSGFFYSSFADNTTLNNPQVQQFIQQMIKKQGFNQTYLNHLFRQITLTPPIIPAAQKPSVSMTWTVYKEKYLTPARIAEGRAFFQAHQKTFLAAQQQYGVPAKIILGILGAETNYGAMQGNFPVLNTLANLAFNYNSHRQRFFTKELTYFLLLCRQHSFDPLQIYGSYDGALGYTQFMPSTYQHYAVSARTNQLPDLLNNPDDAILSIAHYLKLNGWHTGLPIIIPVTSTRDRLNNVAWLPHETFKPIYTPKDISHFSLKITQPLLAPMMLRFIHLQTDHGDQYWLGTQNFYAITRYNNSTYYAMVVYELAKAF